MRSLDTETLEKALRQARERLDRAIRALPKRHEGGEVEEFNQANAELKRLERDLGLAKGEEVAIPYPWTPDWDRGAPLPHVVATAGRVFLLYHVLTPDPDWDGSYVNVIDPASAEEIVLAIVDVKGCYSHRFGGPNDEVFEGHHLAHRGLDGYGAYTVVNSRWLAEHQAINSVHSMHDPKRWEGLKHFFFAFHDDVFECIASGFEVETVRSTFADALSQLIARVVD